MWLPTDYFRPNFHLPFVSNLGHTTHSNSNGWHKNRHNSSCDDVLLLVALLTPFLQNPSEQHQAKSGIQDCSDWLRASLGCPASEVYRLVHEILLQFHSSYQSGCNQEDNNHDNHNEGNHL